MRIFIFACSFLLLAGVINAAVWSVSNRQITKDGEPFVVKGVNYAPLPPGSLPTEATQWGDLFHRDWSHLHDRDIPLLRAAGVNSIRVYQLQLQYPNSDIDLDHTGFFDKLYNNGVKPIYIFITYALSDGFTHAGPFDTRPDNVDYAFQTTDGKWYTLENEVENAVKRDNERDIMVAIAAKYKNHPAVMGFVIGNEQNDAITRSNCKYWEWLDEIDAAVKQQAPDLLTATTIVDDAMITVAESVRCNGLTNMDVWGINSYRGTATTGFHELFDEFTSIINNKALLITEFGCPASARVDNQFAMLPENSRLQADYLESHWNDIVLHFNVCSGGHVFSWVDEWWKNSLPNEQTPNDIAQNFAFPGEWADEEAWGLFAVSVDCDNVASWSTRADQVLPRAVYYRMAKLFGGIDEEPANAYEPINYPRCNGQWVGTPNAPNPPVSIPLPVTQEPESVPIITQSPSVLSVPATENDQTSSAVQHLPFVFLLFFFWL